MVDTWSISLYVRILGSPCARVYSTNTREVLYEA